jgi:hypothetical protein
MHRGAQPLAQFGQGSVGLLADQHEQAAVAVGGHLGGRTAAAGLGGEGAGLAAALQQAADPGNTDAEEVGDLLAGEPAVVAGAHDALAEVLGVGFQRDLLSYSCR